jgi:hypothetical protein
MASRVSEERADSARRGGRVVNGQPGVAGERALTASGQADAVGVGTALGYGGAHRNLQGAN